MPRLEKQLEKNKEEEKQILKKIDGANSRKRIKCASCGKYHPINTLKVIQTHWHIPPSGETGGDYWSEGELQFICSKTGVRNRLLFDNSDIPWEKRKEYENNPEEQFKDKYKKLFKEVEDEHEQEPFGGPNYDFVNNFYVDDNRKRFGLVEKRKKSD